MIDLVRVIADVRMHGLELALGALFDPLDLSAAVNRRASPFRRRLDGLI